MAPQASTPNRLLRDSALAVVAVTWLAGCSISPKPEPPEPPDTAAFLDPGAVQVTPATDYRDPSGLEGGPGSATPAGALVRVWNLDGTADPVDGVVAGDGSFKVELELVPGNEVRVQLIAGDDRSSPVDLLVGSETAPAQPSVRALGNCLTLAPALELVFATGQSVQVHNGCGELVELAAPALRRPVSGLSAGAGSSWPAVLQPGETLTISVDALPGSGSFEEILFVQATAPQQDRRPVTVRGTVP